MKGQGLFWRKLAGAHVLALLLVFTVVHEALSAPAKKSKSPYLKIAFGSCNKDPVSPIWEAITLTKPDAFLWLGDNFYSEAADWNSFEGFQSRYRKDVAAPETQVLFEQVRNYGIWDDHDFGPNNSDSSFPGKTFARRAFIEFWKANPQPPPGLEDSLAFELTFGKTATVLMTDGRTFRVNPDRSVSPTTFGKRQLDWIEERLQNAPTPFVILATGSQVFGNQGTENLSKFPADYKRIEKAIRNSSKRVIILTGDTHSGELTRKKIGNKYVYEITSSPLTAHLREAHSVSPSSNRVFQPVLDHNFGLLTIDKRTNKATFELKSKIGKELLWFEACS